MKSGSTPLPVCRNSVLFDNSLNDKRFRIDIRMENGYEEGCTRGARIIKKTGDVIRFFCLWRKCGLREGTGFRSIGFLCMTSGAMRLS
jgi:hypothetical protein